MDKNTLTAHRKRYLSAENERVEAIVDAMAAVYKEITGEHLTDNCRERISNEIRFL